MDENKPFPELMPDGRPLSAWEAEISFARQDRKAILEAKERLSKLAAIFHVAEIREENEVNTTDRLIILRINGAEMAAAYNPIDAILGAEVKEILKETLT